MRKGIDPPHIVALTIVVCAAIAPAFMLWGRTIGEWAVGIAVYTLITAVVLSLLVLDFVIVRYDVMALLIQALSGSEIVGSVSRLLFVLGQIWVIILSIRIPPSFWEKRLAVLPFQADPDNSALALCIGLFSGAFLLVIVALWMPEDLPGVPEFWNAQVCMDSIFGVGLPWSNPESAAPQTKTQTQTKTEKKPAPEPKKETPAEEKPEEQTPTAPEPATDPTSGEWTEP